MDTGEILLKQGLSALKLSLSNQQIQQLLTYVGLLAKWNKAYNLTAIRNPKNMLTEHVLDGLSIVPYLDREKIIDVGTGAGIPGLIAAIACPDKLFTLLDSNGKKTRFLTQTGFELGLKNIRVLNQRVEECQEKFEIITSRAFASLLDMFRLCQHLLTPNGYFLAMKGPLVDQEITELKQNYSSINIIQQIPLNHALTQQRSLGCLVKFNTK